MCMCVHTYVCTLEHICAYAHVFNEAIEVAIVTCSEHQSCVWHKRIRSWSHVVGHCAPVAEKEKCVCVVCVCLCVWCVCVCVYVCAHARDVRAHAVIVHPTIVSSMGYVVLSGKIQVERHDTHFLT